MMITSENGQASQNLKFLRKDNIIKLVIMEKFVVGDIRISELAFWYQGTLIDEITIEIRKFHVSQIRDSDLRNHKLTNQPVW